MTPTKFEMLFIGNSHTSIHGIPDLTARMIHHLDESLSVQSTFQWVTFLEEAGSNPAIKELVKSRPWKYLILQAQKISSSGRFNYSRAEGIDLAAFAANRGIDTYFYSEWGLLGVANDGNRVESIYRAMADASGAEVLCVGRAWDIALSKNPTMKLHAGDGNHQNEVGAFLSASVIAASLTGKPAKALESFDYPHVTKADKQKLLAACDQMLAEKPIKRRDRKQANDQSATPKSTGGKPKQ